MFDIKSLEGHTTHPTRPHTQRKRLVSSPDLGALAATDRQTTTLKHMTNYDTHRDNNREKSDHELSESEYITTVSTPNLVRTIASLLLGGAVGVMGFAIAPLLKVILLIVLAGAGLLFITIHPYRRDVSAAYMNRYGEYRTTVRRLIPLFPDWLALMILPVIPMQGTFLGIIAFVVASVYNYLVFPWIDGTAYTQEPDTP